MAEQQHRNIAIIRNKVRDIPDFPRKGIVFKDITPILNDPETLNLTSQLLYEPFMGENVDFVAGIESRGFILGARLATDLNAGFIPIRKQGKLPADKISITYELEYGTDQLEIHRDALHHGDRVIIHDDLMATGGSALAATRLINKLGGVVVGYSFVLELSFLNGVSLLDPDIPTHSLIKV